jgi:hypothetical protein
MIRTFVFLCLVLTVLSQEKETDAKVKTEEKIQNVAQGFS